MSRLIRDTFRLSDHTRRLAAARSSRPRVTSRCVYCGSRRVVAGVVPPTCRLHEDLPGMEAL